MTDNRTTELRAMLDERGIHWWAGDDERKTLWESNGLTWEYFNDENGDAWLGFLGACEQDITPEQAIAATLGGDRLTAKQVHDAIFNGSTYASYDGAQYYANGIDMQAIADELNAIGGGECEMVRVSNTQDARKCSACNKITRFDYPLDRDELNYCPKCGAKVRKAVRR